MERAGPDIAANLRIQPIGQKLTQRLLAAVNVLVALKPEL
jgi:hypothetical protein